MNLGRIDYASSATPDGYHCEECGVRGCKLWRLVALPTVAIRLLCCDCAGKAEAVDMSQIDERGRLPARWGRTAMIGWHVPAIPLQDGSSFWAYSSELPEAWQWWCRLPTRTQTRKG